jgi:hypothetical protein
MPDRSVRVVPAVLVVPVVWVVPVGFRAQLLPADGSDKAHP